MAIKAIEGKKRVLFFRLLRDAETKKAAKLALQTSHEWEKSRDNDSTATKDGSKSRSGALETTLSIDALATNDEVNAMLEKSVNDGEVVEVWDVDLSEPTTENKYKAKYAQGLLNSWSTPSDVEDFVTFSTEMTIDGLPQDGEATVTEADQKSIQYAFRDTTIFSEDE